MRLALSRAGMRYTGTIGTYCCYNLKRIKMLFLSVAEPELRQYHRCWLRARQCSPFNIPRVLWHHGRVYWTDANFSPAKVRLLVGFCGPLQVHQLGYLQLLKVRLLTDA
ncbi:hypothetical protein ACFX1Z_023389 [Malus domestica]